jgi:DUF971 family protein
MNGGASAYNDFVRQWYAKPQNKGKKVTEAASEISKAWAASGKKKQSKPKSQAKVQAGKRGAQMRKLRSNPQYNFAPQRKPKSQARVQAGKRGAQMRKLKSNPQYNFAPQRKPKSQKRVLAGKRSVQTRKMRSAAKVPLPSLTQQQQSWLAYQI